MPITADKSKIEKFRGRGVTSPAVTAVALTPNDTNDLVTSADALFIGVGGDIKIDMFDTGTAIVFKNVASGVILPISVNRVYATGTSATDIVALYNHD